MPLTSILRVYRILVRGQAVGGTRGRACRFVCRSRGQTGGSGSGTPDSSTTREPQHCPLALRCRKGHRDFPPCATRGVSTA